MRIKEVEEHTGLTAKAIRLYESKGLLSVSRESQNDYRDYTPEDVTRLKTIALLRKLDIPVKTIKTWTDGQASLEEILRGASEQSRAASRENELKHRLSADLAEFARLEPQGDLTRYVHELEELNALLGELEEVSKRQNASLFWPVCMTVISLGPIGFTIFGILNGQKEQALLAFALSMANVILAALIWSAYFKIPSRERSREGCLSVLILAAAVLVLMFALMIGLENLQERLFVQDPATIRLFRAPWSKLVFLFEIELLIAGFVVLTKPWKGRMLRPAAAAGAVIALFAVNGVLFYGCLTGVSVADETGITKYSFFTPEGKKYAYTDVVMVEGGFSGKKLGLATGSTGTFYYKLYYADGTVENWGESNCSSEEQTWAWMLRLDGWLMEAGVPKRASTEYGEYCDLDQEYVDIFYQVLTTQPE